MPQPAKHRSAIVDAAIILFRKQGYSATGLNDIVELSGAPKGSLYYYFPKGKASIAEAAVAEAGKRFAASMNALVDDKASAATLLIAHTKLVAGWMKKSGYRDGCPVATVLLELAPEDRIVTSAGRDALALRNKVLASRLIADGFAPDRADRLAALCSATLLGALVQARVEKSDKPILAVGRELAQMLANAQKSVEPYRKEPRPWNSKRTAC